MLLWHPKVASRSCEHCLKYEYNKTTGDVEHWPGPNGEKQELQRDPSLPAPCRLYAMGKSTTPCPKGTPEEPKTLSPQNQDAYQFHKECEAVGSWPDDPIVRRNAAIISGKEKAFERYQQRLMLLESRMNKLLGE